MTEDLDSGFEVLEHLDLLHDSKFLGFLDE